MEEKIKAISKQLEEIQKSNTLSEKGAQNIKLRMKLDRLLQCQKDYWLQRAKAKWIKMGDSNAQFFHGWASQRKGYNFITQLMDKNGEWVSDPTELQSLMVEHLKGILSDASTIPDDGSLGSIVEILGHTQISLNNHQKEILNRKVTGEEIKQAFFRMSK